MNRKIMQKGGNKLINNDPKSQEYYLTRVIA
jgi:hypothetical protein